MIEKSISKSYLNTNHLLPFESDRLFLFNIWVLQSGQTLFYYYSPSCLLDRHCRLQCCRRHCRCRRCRHYCCCRLRRCCHRRCCHRHQQIFSEDIWLFVQLLIVTLVKKITGYLSLGELLAATSHEKISRNVSCFTILHFYSSLRAKFSPRHQHLSQRSGNSWRL